MQIQEKVRDQIHESNSIPAMTVENQDNDVQYHDYGDYNPEYDGFSRDDYNIGDFDISSYIDETAEPDGYSKIFPTGNNLNTETAEPNLNQDINDVPDIFQEDKFGPEINTKLATSLKLQYCNKYSNVTSMYE